MSQASGDRRRVVGSESSSIARPAVKVAKATMTSNITGTNASHEKKALPPVVMG